MEKNTSEIRISDLVEQTDKIELIDTLESVDSRRVLLLPILMLFMMILIYDQMHQKKVFQKLPSLK